MTQREERDGSAGHVKERVPGTCKCEGVGQMRGRNLGTLHGGF